MDAVTPKADLRAQVVRPASMAWQKTRFPGCEIKTLLFDAASGLVTVLTRFAPGAVLPDHEHVKIEQTYVIEGRLVDQEGPDAGLEVGPGEFVWRPAGSRHVAGRARRRADARDVPAPQQVLRARLRGQSDSPSHITPSSVRMASGRASPGCGFSKGRKPCA